MEELKITVETGRGQEQVYEWKAKLDESSGKEFTYIYYSWKSRSFCKLMEF